MNRRQMLQASAASFLLSKMGWSQPSTNTPALADLPVLEQPDLLFGFTGDAETERISLARNRNTWTSATRASDISITFHPEPHQARVQLNAPSSFVRRIHLRWRRSLPEDLVVLGDAWERSYGDLAWRSLQPERPLPWYALLHSNAHTAGMGVKTGAGSFAFWQVDASGISLWLDVRNGGNGVLLGQRTLEAATIVQISGAPGESAFRVAQRLCRAMTEGIPIVRKRGATSLDVLYGSNDWYYAYGQNTHNGILRDADLVKSLAPAGGPRPFTVIDDGYQDSSRFPSLAKLATEIRSRDVLPGIWIRPLRAASSAPRNLLLPDARWVGPANEQAPPAYDPTIPEALQAITAVATEACMWGFDLIKHDFTTFELLGQWGSQMGASPTQDNWHFNNRTLTNAEVVTALYRQLRQACGNDRVILGCNTIGHLSVGLFDASRTGDDVSGKAWERTRRTGVNTLAFRLPQHKVFFSLDADCVPITPEVPWAMTRQWLQLVADSGSVLLISPDPRSIGAEQKQALREAFERCTHTPSSEPVDWLETPTPRSWRAQDATRTYDWIQPEGASPFPIGVQRGPD